MFSCRKLVVIGAGLIGGSLIKALREQRCTIGQIVAVGRNLDTLEKARQQAFIDGFTNDAATAVEDADVVVIGTPVGAVQQQFEAIQANLAADCIVTDVGSVKGHVVSSAQSSLKSRFDQFIPAHPISGTEHSGFSASFAGLFQGRYTIITPLAGNDPRHIEKIQLLWQTVGAQVLKMSVEHHDQIFAATSHLPHVLVYALVNAIHNLEDSARYFQVVAGGFLDYTRIASSDAIMWRDVCLTNKQPILNMIEKYKIQLTELQTLIEQDNGNLLEQKFAQAKQVRDELIDQRSAQKLQLKA